MALVDHLTTTLPEAVVLVGTIPQNGQSDKEVNANTYNDRVTQLLYQRLGDGLRVLPVYMEALASVDGDFADLLHPSDVGYRKMADAWFAGLFQAFNLGLLTEAEGDLEGDVPTGDYCTRVSAWYPYGEMASGTRYTPACGVYNCHTDPDVSSSGCFCTMTEPNLETPVQFVPPPKSGLGPLGCADMNDNSSSVRFADLNGDGRAEYIYIDVHGTTDAWMNFWVDNKVGWQDSGEIASGVGARRHQIHFADINGDGRADYLYVHDDGAVEAWLNVPGPDDGPTKLSLGWNPLGIIATGVGKDGAGVRFADLNGDGRAEYIYLYESGAADAWLNLGPQDGQSQYGWWPQGQVASGPFNGATRDNIIFADINGDGRDDYLTVTHTGGAVEAWYNAGSRTPGGLLDANVGWWPQGVIATGVGTSGAGVTFADIDGDGRAEYIDVSYYSGAANMWINECPIA
ncbi:hypothetical protein DL96DRAFT_10202 [Flagelloscypha sp. PMI_526]|nr:hypothetical protein DL96DRAFT_10202 [Flagelloscypha sp. PMI_526]